MYDHMGASLVGCRDSAVHYVSGLHWMSQMLKVINRQDFIPSEVYFQGVLGSVGWGIWRGRLPMNASDLLSQVCRVTEVKGGQTSTVIVFSLKIFHFRWIRTLFRSPVDRVVVFFSCLSSSGTGKSDSFIGFDNGAFNYDTNQGAVIDWCQEHYYNGAIEVQQWWCWWAI